jgi:uncharacterized protein (TIGR00730 family)
LAFSRYTAIVVPHAYIWTIMSTLRRICVYCGSGPGSDPAFAEAARRFGQILMGALSEAVLDHGGEAIGVIPAFLVRREHARERGKVVVTADMHERKQRMFELADAFVALPGGIGTLEEVVEQMTWAQLGQHKKPILLANIRKFWDPLCALLDHMAELQFIRANLEVKYLVAERVDDILPLLTTAIAQVAEADKAMLPNVAGRI